MIMLLICGCNGGILHSAWSHCPGVRAGVFQIRLETSDDVGWKIRIRPRRVPLIQIAIETNSITETICI